MRLQHKMMRKANRASWLMVLWLASLATPLMAQQVPATPEAVRKALNPPAPAKPAAGANTPSAAAPSPQQPQTSKPAPSTNSAIKPAASASGPAANATAIGTVKPAGNSAAKPASGGTLASRGAPRGTGVARRPTPGLGSKGPSSVAPNSAVKPPQPKPVSAANSDVPSSVLGPSVKPVAVRETSTRRDPFAPLLGKDIGGGGGGSAPNLPPGKPGLLISSLRIDGIVSGPNGMIAIVSNVQDRVYFLREGDRLFDGQVEHITMDGISFHQSGKDPFGNAVEREVAKRLNSTPGEQQ
jgi:hypothetical protein